MFTDPIAVPSPESAGSPVSSARGVAPAPAPDALACAPDALAGVPDALAGAIERRGFTALTPVQRAVLAPHLAGRDLRVSSQTGSGKTLAIGFLVAPALASLETRVGKPPSSTPPAPAAGRAAARPAALVVAPTRELAAQVSNELGWLLAPLGATVCTVVGGTSFALELRALARGAHVVVATPGRLVDHLGRGSIDASGVSVVVLDEADSMLDLGFREELEAILAAVPAERRTHLVSATFSRDVLALADRYQRDAARVEGTAHGRANADIEHVAHVVRPDERGAALVNLLLMMPGERTLVFVRTRADASDVADALSSFGFAARPLHGELDQAERTKTLDAFRAGRLTVLVATDVAARGIDVPDVPRVVHFDPPGCADTLTHRSGRTGRAGRKGQSVMLVPAAASEHAARMYRRARVEPSWSPAPTPDDVRRGKLERLRADLLAAVVPAAEGAAERSPGTGAGKAPGDGALRELAADLLAATSPVDLVASLLEAGLGAARDAVGKPLYPCEPMPLTRIEPSRSPARRTDGPREGRSTGPREGRSTGPREGRSTGPREGRSTGPRPRPAYGDSFGGGAPAAGSVRSGSPTPVSDGFVPFRVTWGERHGANPHRLLALVCRRGGVASAQIGAIRIGDVASTVEVAAPAASAFAESAGRPDARDPRVRIDPLGELSGPRPAKQGPAKLGKREAKPAVDVRRARPGSLDGSRPPQRPRRVAG